MEREVGAKIVNGEIIVIDSIDEEKVTIKSKENVNLFINEVECERFKAYGVTSNDKITYTLDEEPVKKNINITVSKDNMEAYMTVEYFPELKYKLKDKGLFLDLAISTEVVSKKEPEHFTLDELYKKLKERGICFGIIEENLNLLLNGSSEEILVAKGAMPINDTPSEIKLFFMPTQMVFPELDSKENVDFKNLFRISNVNSGDKIAEIIPEIIGKNGVDIFGKILERDYIRNEPIMAKQGCKIEGNNVIALINGKAHISNKIISVNPIYTVESVNMETCNIKFYGDIEVYNSVEDNMFVSAGGSLDVSKNVHTSNVITGGEVTILGNAINSKVLCGQIDIRKKEYSDSLIEFKNILNDIINYINKLKLKSIYFEKKDFIKNLVDNNFNDFQKKSLNIMVLNIKNNRKRSELVDFIKNKVLGYNILKIKSLNDLLNLLNILDNEIEYYEKDTIVPLDIRISYCQDSEIKSTGNIIIGGKGEYTSKLTAMKDIIFTKGDSVARGGILSAGGNISLGIVGSKAYIPTILMVPKYAKISVVKAYPSTVFCFGKTKRILENEIENVNVTFNVNKKKIEFSKSGL